MSINVLTVSGHCGNDMEVRYTKNGKAVGAFSLPASSGWGENETTSWLQCKVFGERAEKIAPYIVKGSVVTATGEFVLEQWEKDGVKHSKAVMIVRDIQLPPKSSQQTAQTPQSANNLDNGGFDDDSIPF